jgi:hypothetical protein
MRASDPWSQDARVFRGLCTVGARVLPTRNGIAAKERRDRKEMKKPKKQISQKITKDTKTEPNMNLLNRLSVFAAFC